MTIRKAYLRSTARTRLVLAGVMLTSIHSNTYKERLGERTLA